MTRLIDALVKKKKNRAHENEILMRRPLASSYKKETEGGLGLGSRPGQPDCPIDNL